MKKNKYILLTTMLFLFNIQPTFATCTQEEINNFKKIEDEYTVKYEIDKSTQKYNLYFTATMPQQYYYKIYTDEALNCDAQSDTTIKCADFVSGKYEVQIIGVTKSCNDALKNIIINLPKYNKYSESELCKGIEEFVLCNAAYEKEIDYETFVSRVETYKKTLTKKEEQNKPIEEEKDEQKNELLNNIINYIKNYWLECLIVMVFIVLVIITIIITAKSIRKSRRLE